MIELIQNVLNTKLIDNVSMIVSQTSSPQSIEGISCYAIQYSWSTATFTGNEVINAYGSNDKIIWTPVDTFIPSGSTGNRLTNVEKAGYRFVKVDYTATTSAGTLLVTISGKVI